MEKRAQEGNELMQELKKKIAKSPNKAQPKVYIKITCCKD